MNFQTAGTGFAIGWVFWLFGWWLQFRFAVDVKTLDFIKSSGAFLIVYPPKWLKWLCGLPFLKRAEWDVPSLNFQLAGLILIVVSPLMIFIHPEWAGITLIFSVLVIFVVWARLAKRWR